MAPRFPGRPALGRRNGFETSMKEIDQALERVNLVDVYPRGADPFRPAPGIGGPATGILIDEAPSVEALLTGNITSMGPRPKVFQRGGNFQISVANNPQPLVNGVIECDGFIIDVASTVGNSLFIGFGNSVTATSGLEIRPGLPVFLSPDNTREQWELQRSLEALVALLSAQAGLSKPLLAPFKAPRVVFNLNDFSIIAPVAGPTVASVMYFTTPESQ